MFAESTATLESDVKDKRESIVEDVELPDHHYTIKNIIFSYSFVQPPYLFTACCNRCSIIFCVAFLNINFSNKSFYCTVVTVVLYVGLDTLC